ncbi:MAG: DUF4331 domain-containing protein [Rhodoferax sp.]|nr:DUF4331 domain-containing protein [Rhodoferax sp.]
MTLKLTHLAKACLLLVAAGSALASSHREAPFITTSPKVDGTDFYMFSSYEAGRTGYVTMIANYQPLQDAYGGPNYFKMDPNALYEIHLDNNGDAKEDLTFQFRFNNTLAAAGAGVKIPVGSASVAIPLSQAGTVANLADGNLNVAETYSVKVVRGDRRAGTSASVVKASGGSAVLEKPADFIGDKTFGSSAAYAAYADKHVHTVTIPGCAMPAKVFVGQRQEGFAVNLGPIFDLVNATAAQITNPANINAFASKSIQDKNVTSMAVEVHKSCLTAGSDPVIGGWTTASLRQGRLLNGAPASGLQTTEKVGGSWVQVSRLGNPLVNEVVIGLPDKDKFNASKPSGDLQFATYVTNPTLPSLLGLVLAGDLKALAPTNFPRTDLLNVFLTGIGGVNKPAGTVTPSEMLRLNTAIAPVAYADQNRLGVAGEVLRVGGAANLAQAKDLAGFPNGRRPKDDVVDIALVAMLGGLCVVNSNGTIAGITASSNADVLGLNTFTIPGTTPTVLKSECKVANVPLGATSAAVHDGVDQAAVTFLSSFPYLNTPNSGSTPKQ